ncbi:MAG: response regulator transcription factor [Clostridiales bacterium]|jgi:DNA-binding response OmpR family regulator|nr:response regulator transcription factor [Clostridiales bacterium]
MNILIIEDERELAEALATLMKQNKFACDTVFDGNDGVDYALTDIYDVIILDVMLPRKNGFEVLKELRVNKLETPILMLTAKADVDDKIMGLDCGADDYLTKPFNSSELLARIRALSRRKDEYTGIFLEFGDCKLNIATGELICGEKKISLGAKEFQIMELLMQNSSKITSKERFNEKIWGYDSEAEYNTIEVYISFLRKKIMAINAQIIIKTTRGMGYRLYDKKAEN